MKLTVTLICTLLSVGVQSQVKQTPLATVEVNVVNTKKQPLKGEEVLFINAVGKSYTARTSADGKVSLQLPPGNTYDIVFKAMSDSTVQGKMKIDSLPDGAFFSKPFKVNITYEPAKLFTLNHVFFDVGKATLRQESYKELLQLVDYLQGRPSQKIEIGGHTDNTGISANNLTLSKHRAEAVKKYLVSKGIAADRLIAIGYGDTQAIANNATEQGKQQNRRTEVRILE